MTNEQLAVLVAIIGVILYVAIRVYFVGKQIDQDLPNYRKDDTIDKSRK